MYLNEIYCSGDIICEGGLKVRRLLTTEGEIPYIEGTGLGNRLVKFISEGGSGFKNSEFELLTENEKSLLTVYDAKRLTIKFNNLATEALDLLCEKTSDITKVTLSLLDSTVTINSQGNKVFSGNNSQIEVTSTKDITLSDGVWVFV